MDSIKVCISDKIMQDSIEYKSIKDSNKKQNIYNIAKILYSDEDSNNELLQQLKKDFLDDNKRIFEIPLNKLKIYHKDEAKVCSYGGLFVKDEVVKQSLNSTTISRHQQNIFDKLEHTNKNIFNKENLKSFLKNKYFKYFSSESKKNKKILQDSNKTKILFFCEYWSNFYHFVFEAYPRLIMLIKECRNKNLDFYIIAPPKYRKLIKYHRWFIDEVFESLKISKDKILYLDHQNYDIKNIYYCSNPQCNSKYILPAINQLKAYYTNWGGQQGIGDRIYISRKKSPRRFLDNENEITDILEKHFGFQILYMEDYNLCEKINIIQNAKVVMSIEGTSLINGLFMNGKDSKLISLRSFDMTEHLFIICSMFKNIEFLPIVCDIKNKVGDSAFWVESDLYLDKDYLIKKLKEYEIEPIN